MTTEIINNQQTSTQLINLTALGQQSLTSAPFPHLVIPNFINADFLARVVADFPNIENRGSIPASSVALNPLFQQLINELEGEALRHTIAEKFLMNLEDKPTMLTLRGYTTTRDGYIHTDSKDKLITLLLYLNPTWDTTEGNLRLLNSNQSLEDYFLEIPAKAGTCLLFKVTPNGWHGHKPFIGKRLSLQLNYLTGQAALTKHEGLHKFTAFLKRSFKRRPGRKPGSDSQG